MGHVHSNDTSCPTCHPRKPPSETTWTLEIIGALADLGVASCAGFAVYYAMTGNAKAAAYMTGLVVLNFTHARKGSRTWPS